MDDFPQILAIDDDLKFLEAVQESFKSEYKLTLAADGMAAMKSISQSAPDCPVSPKRTGFGLVNLT